MLNIKLVDAGKHKIEVIKLVRLFTKLGLKESKDLVDNLPAILVSKNEDISIEQIKKNFGAIGAIVEEIKEETNPPANAAGTNDSHIQQDIKPPVQIIKDFDKNQTVTTLSKPKLALRPAIIFAMVAAMLHTYLSVQLGQFTFYIVLVVAVGVAFFLRKNNIRADKNLGIASASITLLYFFASILFNWIIFFVLYDYVLPLNPFSIFFSLFSSGNVLVLISATLSYVMASNKNIFKNLYVEGPPDKNLAKNIMEKKHQRHHKEKEKF